MKLFAVYSVKGGVGKTATAVNLAYLSSREGARTLLWDLDPQGGTTFYLRVKPRVKGGAAKLLRGATNVGKRIRGTDFPSFDLLPSDVDYRNLDLYLDASKKPLRRLRGVLDPLADQYDHVFLDCAPTMSLVSESVFRAADVLIVPTIPTTLSMRTLEQVRALLKGRRNKPRVLPFHGMVDRRRKLHRSIVADPAGSPYTFLETTIPNATDVERMGVERAPLPYFAPRSKAARAYETLWHEILEKA